MPGVRRNAKKKEEERKQDMHEVVCGCILKRNMQANQFL